MAKQPDLMHAFTFATAVRFARADNDTEMAIVKDALADIPPENVTEFFVLILADLVGIVRDHVTPEQLAALDAGNLGWL